MSDARWLEIDVSPQARATSLPADIACFGQAIGR